MARLSVTPGKIVVRLPGETVAHFRIWWFSSFPGTAGGAGHGDPRLSGTPIEWRCSLEESHREAATAERALIGRDTGAGVGSEKGQWAGRPSPESSSDRAGLIDPDQSTGVSEIAPRKIARTATHGQFVPRRSSTLAGLSGINVLCPARCNVCSSGAASRSGSVRFRFAAVQPAQGNGRVTT